MGKWKGLLEEYKEWLPVTEKTPALTLQEGNTPLIYLENLSKDLGVNIYVKLEGANPTGSFKDRGMVMAVAKAKEEGKEILICASTGNTSASAAAYGARANMRTIVVIPAGNVALGKLAQAKMYGAEIVEIEDNFDEALEMVRITAGDKVELVNSINPFRLEGQKTIAYETIEQLGKVPDIFVLPVGNAGNITASWIGFNEYRDKYGGKRPEILGVQADGAAPIVYDRVFEKPETVASAIRIGNPINWNNANKAIEESKGHILSVTDDEILKAYKLLAEKDGIFAEPASSATIAGIIKRVKSGDIKKDSTIVGVLTGNGLKDHKTAINVNLEDLVLSKKELIDIFPELGDGSKKELTIKTSGTTANLGPGFDSFGMALDLYMEIKLMDNDKWEIEYLDEEYKSLRTDEKNLILSSMFKTLDKYEMKVEPKKLIVSSDIPFERGVGSSASAIVGGIEVANQLADLNMSKKEKLQIANEIEGHPDNVAAVIYGGMTMVAEGDEDINIIDLDAPDLEVLLMIPENKLDTEESRSVLPEYVSHRDAIDNGSFEALLIGSLIKKDYILMGEMMESDKLHEPYRKNMFPRFDEIRKTAKAAGAYGMSLSGAGPSLIVIVAKEYVEKVEKALYGFKEYKTIRTRPVEKGIVVYR